MNIEIGTKIYFNNEDEGQTVTNIKVNQYSDSPEVYFDNGESCSATNAFKHATAWG